MALYLGSSPKLKIALTTGTATLRIPSSSTTPINSAMLKSSDGYVLKSSDGLYLTAKEDD